MNILVADDHEVIYYGVVKLLKDHLGIGQFKHATNGEGIISVLEVFDPQLLILDIVMPGVKNVSFVERIAALKPDMKIVIFSSLDEQLFGIYFVCAGAHAFVNKRSSFDVLKLAVDSVLSGHIFLSRSLHTKVNEVVKSKAYPDPFKGLSQREQEIMLLLFDGYTNKEIGHMLSLSPTAVSTYRARVLSKFPDYNMMQIRDLYYLLQR